MENYELFLEISDNYYTRQYVVNPEYTNGLQTTIFAECSRNVQGINGHYYALDVYLSVDNDPVREFYVGITFGDRQIEKTVLDQEINKWIVQFVTEEGFLDYLETLLEERVALENVEAGQQPGVVTINSQFTHVSHNFYVCEYDLDPKLAGGRRVEIYAECSPTVEDPEGNYYWLRIYLSVGYNPTRELITERLFGESPMSRIQLNSEIETRVVEIINDELFSEYLEEYLQKEKLLEDTKREMPPY